MCRGGMSYGMCCTECVENIDGKKNFWYAVISNKVTFDAKDSSIIKTVVQVDGLGRAVITMFCMRD